MSKIMVTVDFKFSTQCQNDIPISEYIKGDIDEQMIFKIGNDLHVNATKILDIDCSDDDYIDPISNKKYYDIHTYVLSNVQHLPINSTLTEVDHTRIRLQVAVDTLLTLMSSIKRSTGRLYNVAKTAFISNQLSVGIAIRELTIKSGSYINHIKTPILFSDSTRNIYTGETVYFVHLNRLPYIGKAVVRGYGVDEFTLESELYLVGFIPNLVSDFIRLKSSEESTFFFNTKFFTNKANAEDYVKKQLNIIKEQAISDINKLFEKKIAPTDADYKVYNTYNDISLSSSTINKYHLQLEILTNELEYLIYSNFSNTAYNAADDIVTMLKIGN